MNQQNSGIAIASLVLGIVSLVCVFFVNAWVGVIAAIVGLVLAIMARKQAPSGMATAGLVLSIIALAVCAVVVIAIIACAGFIFSQIL